jgi:acetate---CoA ligase (ADP-forming)
MAGDARVLFDPRSVAVVGASAKPGKWGHVLAQGALAGADRRAVYLVNRDGGEILGRRAYGSLAELPAAPELVVLAVPAAGFDAAVEEAVARGARAIVGISAGLGEMGPEGQRRERALGAQVRAAGARLLGPNCLGVVDTHAQLQLAWSAFQHGPVGLISQSGNLALEIGELLAAQGLGISRFASLGNQADLDAAELLPALAADERTRVIALYVEDFRDGRAFARACAAAGKPVVLLSAGASAAGARIAYGHTGALVSDSRAIEAACRAAGVVRVSTPKELADAAQALLAPARPAGRRIGVIGDGGGHNAIAADALVALGFELPALSERVAGEIAALLPDNAVTANPVDFAGGGERDVTTYPRVARLLLASGDVDAVLLTGYFGGYGDEGERRAAEALAGLAPLVVHTMFASGPAITALRSAGVPVCREIEAAARTLDVLAPRAGGVVPELPPPLPPSGVDGYWGARELVAAAGIEVVPARAVHSADEAERAAAALGFPVVLKALGAVHKSDGGGVVVGIADAPRLRRELEARAAPEFSVERMAPLADGVELIVGTRQDPRFGPIVLVGVGGLYTEILDDVAVALAPVDAATARELLESLRGAALLAGARGRPPLDVAAAAGAVAALSRLGAARPDLGEIEINPLLVTPAGALALDARVMTSERSAFPHGAMFTDATAR